MRMKTLKSNIAEYGFLAEHEIVMSRTDALALVDQAGVPSFERLVNCARAKADLPDDAWLPAERVIRRARRRSLPASRGIRYALIVLAVLVLLFFSVTPQGRAIAERAAFELGSALVHWRDNELRIDYAGQYNDPPPGEHSDGEDRPVIEHDSENRSFDSLEELMRYVDRSLLYPFDIEGVVFDTASVETSGGLSVVSTRSAISDGMLIISVYLSGHTAANDGSLAYTAISNIDCSEVYEKDIFGTNCIFGIGEGRCVCSFTADGGYYYIDGETDKAGIEAIVSDMLRPED